MKLLIETTRALYEGTGAGKKTPQVQKIIGLVTGFDADQLEEFLNGLVVGFADTWDSIEDGGDAAGAAKMRNGFKALAAAWKNRSGN